MITRRKIEAGLVSWQVGLISVAFIVFLAATVILIYWYLFGNSHLKNSAAAAPANPNIFTYKKHSLTNVMLEGILESK